MPCLKKSFSFQPFHLVCKKILNFPTTFPFFVIVLVDLKHFIVRHYKTSPIIIINPVKYSRNYGQFDLIAVYKICSLNKAFFIGVVIYDKIIKGEGSYNMSCKSNLTFINLKLLKKILLLYIIEQFLHAGKKSAIQIKKNQTK